MYLCASRKESKRRPSTTVFTLWYLLRLVFTGIGHYRLEALMQRQQRGFHPVLSDEHIDRHGGHQGAVWVGNDVEVSGTGSEEHEQLVARDADLFLRKRRKFTLDWRRCPCCLLRHYSTSVNPVTTP